MKTSPDATAAPVTKAPGSDWARVISFGIPSLDELLGRPGDMSDSVRQPDDFGIGVGPGESTSLCLIGPDGTGKSVLALHLVSQYAAVTRDPNTRIFYASTDLSFAKATSIWENFALDRPGDRLRDLEDLLPLGRARVRRPADHFASLRVELDPYHPLILRHAAHDVQNPGKIVGLPLTDYLTGAPRRTCNTPCTQVGRRACERSHGQWCHRVAFIDMESSTAGDDWGLINRLLATLDRPQANDGIEPDRHLLVIDAVEGLETLGGRRDVFGHERERRSRIAQILRAAKGKCHVLFIVEEPKEHQRLPEEFVSDAVIRLRVERQRDYARRTIEIEKLRGQAYVRGQHDCLIRRGAGSQTGRQENPDHRTFRLPDPSRLADDRRSFHLSEAGPEKAYFLVIHSLHYLSREVMELPLPAPVVSGPAGRVDPRTRIVLRQPEGLCGFGIRYLDEMIGRQGRATVPAGAALRGDSEGLPWGSVTALIGDDGTHKGRLGRAFLAQAFNIHGPISDWDGSEQGVALMLTVQPLDNDTLARRFLNHHGEIGDRPEDPGDLPSEYQELIQQCRRVIDQEVPKLAKMPRATATLKRAAERFRIPSGDTRLSTSSSLLIQEVESRITLISQHAEPLIELDEAFRQIYEVARSLRVKARELREWAHRTSAGIPGVRRVPSADRRDAEALYLRATGLEAAASDLDGLLLSLSPVREFASSFRELRRRAEEWVRESRAATGAGVPNGGANEGDDAVANAAEMERKVFRITPGIVRSAEPLRSLGGSLRNLARNLLDQSRRAELLVRFLAVKRRTVCRRLEIHHMTSAALFHIVHALVEEGVDRVLWKSEPPDHSQIPVEKAPGRVRLVIDDWSGILNAYPEIRNDPLILPFLIFYLKRRGVTSLIIDNQPGRLGHILSQEISRVLRALVPYHLYTWHVTFYGEKRVAIAALPPISDDKAVVVRELKPLEQAVEDLTVDPHFEFYSGFEDDASPSHAVPLQVRLYQDTEVRADAPPGVRTLRSHEADLFEDDAALRMREEDSYLSNVSAILARLYGNGGDVVEIEPPTGYQTLSDFVRLQGGSSLEHTLVVQIDEYWAHDSKSLYNINEYMDAVTTGPSGDVQSIEDPFQVFQPTEGDDALWRGGDEPLRRHQGFRTVGYSLAPPRSGGLPSASFRRLDEPDPDSYHRLDDRVPYTVDFGLLLSDRRTWASSFDEKVGPVGQELSLGEIWDSLAPPFALEPFARRPRPVSWRVFFEACSVVAAHHAESSGSHPLPGAAPVPFDIDLRTPETLSCLVLELWASEIYASRDDDPAHPGQRVGSWPVDDDRIFPSRRDKPVGWGLVDLLSEERFRRALFRAWLLLNAVLTLKQLKCDRFAPRPRPGSTDSVACRHWYATAACTVALHPGRQLTPLRLPGHFTTRGDWFLGIALGSRSRRLGERALDLLNSRRANLARFQLGLGLPVRGYGVTDPEFVEDPGRPNQFRPVIEWADAEFRSPFVVEDGAGRPHRLLLHHFWWLSGRPGPLPFEDLVEGQKEHEFFHLWRSRLRSYERHARIWAKWLVYAFEAMQSPSELRPGKPLDFATSLFTTYDGLEHWMKTPRTNTRGNARYPATAFDRFDQLCEELLRALRRSTPLPGSR